MITDHGRLKGDGCADEGQDGQTRTLGADHGSRITAVIISMNTLVYANHKMILWIADCCG